MLLFEFFPLFVMLVSVAAAVWLFVLDRQSRLVNRREVGLPENAPHPRSRHRRGAVRS